MIYIKKIWAGLAIFTILAIGISLLSVEIQFKSVVAMLGFLVFGMVSDYKNISSKIKFWITLFLSAMVYAAFAPLVHIGNFLGISFDMSEVFAFILIPVGMVLFFKANKEIDGKNNLILYISTIILGAYSYMGYMFSDETLWYISGITVGVNLFLIVVSYVTKQYAQGYTLNFSIGSIIVFSSLHAISQGYITPISLLLLVAIPLLDISIVVIRRIAHGQSPFVVDHMHIYDVVLIQQNKNKRKTIFLISLLQLLFTLIGLGFKVRDDIIPLIMFVLLVVIFYMILSVRRY